MDPGLTPFLLIYSGLRVHFSVRWEGKGLCWTAWGEDVRERMGRGEEERNECGFLSSVVFFWMVKPLNTKRTAMTWKVGVQVIELRDCRLSSPHTLSVEGEQWLIILWNTSKGTGLGWVLGKFEESWASLLLYNSNSQQLYSFYDVSAVIFRS